MLTEQQTNAIVDHLCDLGLLSRAGKHYDAPPVVKTHFSEKLRGERLEAFQAAHKRLYDFHRFQKLPKVFQNETAYALLAFISSFPQGEEALFTAVRERKWVEGWSDILPTGLRNASWETLQTAVAELRPPYFNGALSVFRPDKSEDMASLFAAIAHGCAAGEAESAWSEVYMPRVRRGNEDHAVRVLGLHGEELSAIGNFFEQPWSRADPKLSESRQALLFNIAGFRLRALGRTRDAIGPMRANRDLAIQRLDSRGAARASLNLSEVLMITGNGAEAVSAAVLAVQQADRADDQFLRLRARATHANALLHSGQLVAAEGFFAEAEGLQREMQPNIPILYSLQGYEYCDLLLERGLAQQVIGRVSAMRKWVPDQGDPLTDALVQLLQGRARLLLLLGSAQTLRKRNLNVVALFRHLVTVWRNRANVVGRHFELAMEALRRTNNLDFLVPCLIAQAGVYRLSDEHRKARASLNEATEIAERSGLKLYMIDCLLETARILIDQPNLLPEGSQVQQVLRRIDTLVAETGSLRRAPGVAILRARVAHLEQDDTQAVRFLRDALVAIESEGAWTYLRELRETPWITDVASVDAELRRLETHYSLYATRNDGFEVRRGRRRARKPSAASSVEERGSSRGVSVDSDALVSTRTMDIIVALLFLLASSIFLYNSTGLGFNWREGEGPAPGYFPFYVALIMAGASAINLFRAVFRMEPGGDGPFVSTRAFGRVLMVLVPLLLYVALIGGVSLGPVHIPRLGIYVASAIFIFCFMLIVGRENPLKAFVVATLTSIALFLMFEKWFLLPLPKGPLEVWLGYSLPP